MAYIEREAFLEQEREQYCKDCARRKGMKNGKMRIVYEIGDAPCRSCGIGDVLDDVEDFPAADVRPVVRAKWIGQRADSEMCSACGVRFYISALFAVGGNNEPNFCPNCGADMRGERDV